MDTKWKKAAGIIGGMCIAFAAGMGAEKVCADQPITLWLDEQQIQTDTAPIIVNDRTMVPIRAIAEGLNLEVEWDAEKRQVLMTKPLPPIEPEVPPELPVYPDVPVLPPVNVEPIPPVDLEPVPPVMMLPDDKKPMVIPPAQIPELRVYPPVNYPVPDSPVQQLDAFACEPILGQAEVSAEQLQKLAWQHNPQAPNVAQLYLDIGKIYGIRGDIAFCQAAKETGWWEYGNLVQPYQNNYCGLAATGAPATGEEELYGADASKVWYVPGVHGAIFATPADGIEAQIQHLYAYCCKKPLPAGRDIIDPRFTLVKRGIAPTWQDLNGRWAVPGVGYGESILNDYYAEAVH